MSGRHRTPGIKAVGPAIHALLQENPRMPATVLAAFLGVFVAVLVAGISLTVAGAAGIIDRRRVLGLMRLMGMPVAVLRRVVVREAAVPLFAVLVLSVGLGFLVAWFMIYSLGGDRSITWPGMSYYTAFVTSLLLALGAVAATFGLLGTNTAITATRFG